jgi:hypothetical protein
VIHLRTFTLLPQMVDTLTARLQILVDGSPTLTPTSAEARRLADDRPCQGERVDPAGSVFGGLYDAGKAARYEENRVDDGGRGTPSHRA